MVPPHFPHKYYVHFVCNKASRYGGLPTDHLHFQVWCKLKVTNLDPAYPILAALYSRGKRLRKLPANFAIDEKKLPVVGKVTFIRLVSAQGTVSILGQSFKVGKRFKFQHVKATIYTKYQKLKVYHKGKLIKEFPYPLSQKSSNNSTMRCHRKLSQNSTTVCCHIAASLGLQLCAFCCCGLASPARLPQKGLRGTLVREG